MMKHFLLFLSLSVVYGLPVGDWIPVENLVQSEQERSPLLGDMLPKLGHVVQEDLKPAVQKDLPLQETQVQQKEPANDISLEEQEPDVQEEVTEESESKEQVELVEEEAQDERSDQEMLSMGPVENNPLSNMVEPEMVEEELMQQEMLMPDKPLAEEDDLTEEESLMELESGPEIQEIHQHNPNEYVFEPEIESQAETEERNIQQEETALTGEGYLTQEELLQNFEYQQLYRPQMQEDPVETIYQMDPVVESEASEDLTLMQDSLQSEPADHKVLLDEEELMIADQSHLEDPLITQESEEEPAKRANSVLAKHSRFCRGVAIAGKCYRFFPGPTRAYNAEYFCQNQFRNGHLASVTSSYIHNQLIQLMELNGGRRRAWIGGLRYLDTARFIWLDGEHWYYNGWFPGEPNNKDGNENCVELHSNGKFNDLRCWQPLAFICSYPY